MRSTLITLVFLIAMGCSASNGTTQVNKSPTPAASSTLPVYGYEIVKSYPHDPKAFTQGLVFHNGFLYESTGQFGQSSLRKVEIETGKVVQKFDLPRDSFAEGITLLGDKIYQLTWQEGLVRVFDVNDFKLVKEFTYQGEGWGIATDGTNLIMTDSTHVLRVINPDTFKSSKMLVVIKEDGKPLMRLNELEFVKGELWGNIWHSEEPRTLGKPNYIARIDPNTGKLLGWIDLDGISPDDVRRDPENTLNGIAYDAENDRIFVTGKNWRKLFEIKITGPKDK